MSNVAVALRHEISRLAKKEAKTQVQPLRSALVRYKNDIAVLKRQVATLKREVASKGVRRDQTEIQLGEAADESSTSVKVHFVPKGLVSLRRRLGLTSAELARMLGVSPQSIYNWEHGVSRPRQAQLVKLSSLRTAGKREVQAFLASLSDTISS